MDARIKILLPPTEEIHGEGLNGEFVALRGEEVHYPLQQSQAGYAPASSVTLTVQKGVTGFVDYKLRMKAVSSLIVNEKDELFKDALYDKERKQYSERKERYSGGLNIPVLSWIGANLSAHVDRDCMRRIADAFGVREYNRRASITEESLRSLTKKKVEISGSLSATGITDDPLTVQAFIKVAQVRLNTGEILTVVSNNRKDVVTATTDGTVVPSDDTELKIVSLDE